MKKMNVKIEIYVEIKYNVLLKKYICNRMYDIYKLYYTIKLYVDHEEIVTEIIIRTDKGKRRKNFLIQRDMTHASSI